MGDEMRFVEDGDGQWYLIHSHDLEKFSRLLDLQDYDEFKSSFGLYSCEHPSQYVITGYRSNGL